MNEPTQLLGRAPGIAGHLPGGCRSSKGGADMTARVRVEKRLEPLPGFAGPFGVAFELYDVWSGAKRLYSGSSKAEAQRVARRERRRLRKPKP